MYHLTFEVILLLFAIAVAITAVAKKLQQPYPIALVIVGALLGLLPLPELEPLKNFVVSDEVFHFAIVSIFLPALLGESVMKLPFGPLLKNRRPILLLAIGGTLISFGLVALTSSWLLGVSVQVAFVFAAVMSATDPVSVISIFKSMRVDHRLSIVIEGESLLNDGIAVVLFNISAFYLLEYMHAGTMGLLLGVIEFVKVVAGGVLIGALLGWIVSQLLRLYDDYPLEIVFSILLYYGAFFIAEHFEVSGVIAVVAAGLVFGNYGARVGLSSSAQLTIDSFWDVMAFIANIMVFLMVGLEIARISFADKGWLIAGAILSVIVSRAVAVYVPLLFAKKFPLSWQHILNWGGLRGSLSIALTLSLPANFPGREDILVLTFSYVLFSLIVQGLTVKPLIKWLHIPTE